VPVPHQPVSGRELASLGLSIFGNVPDRCGSGVVLDVL